MAGVRGNGLLKAVDRYVGIPLLAALSVLPKRRDFVPKRVRRIGLMKTAAIGDTLLLAGLLEDVRCAFPDAAIVAVTGPENRAAAELLPGRADEHVMVSPARPLAAVLAVRRAMLDVIVDFGAWPRFDALLAALSGARYRVGFRTAGQARGGAYDLTVEHSADVHERENYRQLVSLIGVNACTPPHVVAPGIVDPSRLPSGPFAVFHPWSGGYMHQRKEWPAERWVELARAVARKKMSVMLTGSRGDRSRNDDLARMISAAGAEARNTAGDFSLGELTDVLVASDVVVSVNTGVMHLAALVGARTVSLEGPTPVSRWGPIGPRVRSVSSTLPGCGYLNLGFEYAGQRGDCMSGVSVDAVLDAIDALRERPLVLE